jgi:2-hydroxychromene-2-carboxylate isomerase
MAGADEGFDIESIRNESVQPVMPAGPLDDPGSEHDPGRPVFFFDLGSPYAWLVAERIGHTYPTAIWQPVCQRDISDAPLWDGDRERIEKLAADAGLLTPRWPSIDQPDTREAMLVAAFCKSIGRAASFALAAFRQAYNGGRDLAERDTLLIAAAACELHPRAILQAIELESTRVQLAAAATLASDQRVTELPALALGDRRLLAAELLEK